MRTYLSCVKVETLCANSLAEVGVAVGDFVEALEASRLSQDISTAVYQQLVALDDFVTFKKLMVSIIDYCMYRTHGTDSHRTINARDPRHSSLRMYVRNHDLTALFYSTRSYCSNIHDG